jgi:hypothetical protein
MDDDCRIMYVQNKEHRCLIVDCIKPIAPVIIDDGSVTAALVPHGPLPFPYPFGPPPVASPEPALWAIVAVILLWLALNRRSF